MGRFLLGLAVAGVCFWGYQRFGGGFATAAGDAPGESDPVATRASAAQLQDLSSDVGEAGAAVDGDDGFTDPDIAAPTVVAATESGDSLDAFIAAIEAADPQACSRAFAVLIRLAGPERDRLAAALEKRAQAVDDIGVLVALLGRGNAYLHCDEGRSAARAAIERAAALPKPAALAATNRMLESAMRGPIEAGDVAAKTLVDEIGRKHEGLVRQVVFNPMSAAGSKRYQVQPGDTLTGIAERFRERLGLKVEAGTLAVINRISNPNSVPAGHVLRIPVEPLRTVVEKRSFLMAVYLGDTIIRLYWIAHGKDGHDTPEATFEITSKVEHPDWPHPDGRVIAYGDPENPLGTHFVKFRHEAYSGFGVHGTFEPRSIGTRASLGCIRLDNDHIADYFRLVPRGTLVEVRNSL